MKMRFLGFFLAISLPLCVFSNGVDDAFEIKGTDLTKFYEAALKQESHDLPNMDSFKVILVPGFLSNEILALKGVSLPQIPLGEYFDDEIEWLEEHKIEHELLKIQSEQSKEYNAKLIRKAIVSSKKPIILFTHSKGGIDSLEALIYGKEEIRHKVKGWIAIQSPFQGTPLANLFINNRILYFLSERIIHRLGGAISSVKCMTLESRKKYLSENSESIAKVLAAIPTISFAAWKKNEKDKVDSSLELLRNYFENMGYENDGAVPWRSAILPGSNYIVFEGADHQMTIQKSPMKNFNRKEMIEVLSYLLLQKVEQHGALNQ